MKKLGSLLMGVVLLTATTFAQAKKEEKKGAEKAKTSQSAPRLKKDGTADKRFKAAKDTSVVRKKDGTPDKRFKKSKKG